MAVKLTIDKKIENSIPWQVVLEQDDVYVNLKLVDPQDEYNYVYILRLQPEGTIYKYSHIKSNSGLKLNDSGQIVEEQQ
jgi:hypothetical protein